MKLQLDDEAHAIHLDIYQRVATEVECSDEDILRTAQLQFRRWAERQGADWMLVVARLPFAKVSATEIQLAA